ncbi:5'-3' exoribonuclease 2 [Sporothrix stenoceras]|uniref:5'-3' exoribonuclease 2 n=1 Tax=Sporothrix stenoceras TaxID=5173 RepID=A0ABR3ZSL5_9PEZI
MTNWAPGEKETKVVDMSGSPYMALILARVGSVEELKDSLWHAGISPTSLPNLAHVHSIQDVSAMKEKDLLLNTAMELVDFQYLEDALQNRTLLWLNELAKEKPNVILHL